MCCHEPSSTLSIVCVLGLLGIVAVAALLVGEGMSARETTAEEALLAPVASEEKRVLEGAAEQKSLTKLRLAMKCLNCDQSIICGENSSLGDFLTQPLVKGLAMGCVHHVN